MSLGFGIFLWIVGLVLFYIIIETAVRRGIDSSKLGERIEKIEETINKNNSPK
ncbi:hypothetical protein ACFFIX_26150 [Metabacillus herbersteinensis]|uniref:CcmD family protein n=1 Tax=Metabacillus herbersteinensis TaxID=283816 RepID=A0ABV6GPL2_9BACI